MPYTTHPDYEREPEIIRGMVTEEEYAWMDDIQRSRLLDDLCYPEPEE